MDAGDEDLYKLDLGKQYHEAETNTNEEVVLMR
jgi:hypothetical protein